MKWKKLGQIYCPKSNEKYSHAMFPVVETIDETKSIVRIYYTHRDRDNYGFPTYLDACISGESCSVLYNLHDPIIDRPAIGTFDDSGVNITSMVQVGDRKLFYYYGWNLGITVPFRNSIGLAEKFQTRDMLVRLFDGPILDRSRDFPYLCATPCVLHDGEKFRMWFASGEPWITIDNQLAIACHVGYAESMNGIDWVRQKEPAVGHDDNTDHVISTPCVIHEDGLYRMWYSYRGKKYRIGYAESEDGKHFTRMDNAVGITVSENSWDSDMVCYPKVFDLGDCRYMVYCGNDYGKTGFGLAILGSS